MLIGQSRRAEGYISLNLMLIMWSGKECATGIIASVGQHNTLQDIVHLVAGKPEKQAGGQRRDGCSSRFSLCHMGRLSEPASFYCVDKDVIDYCHDSSLCCTGLCYSHTSCANQKAGSCNSRRAKGS